jgi:hypothetical protein
MTMRFAAVHESACGTMRRFGNVGSIVVIESKADTTRTPSNRRSRPISAIRTVGLRRKAS